MKHIWRTIFIILVLFASCKKQETKPKYASINIINASVGAGTVKVNYYGKQIKWATLTGSDASLNYASNKIFTIFNLTNDFSLPIVPSLDTLNYIFNEKIQINPEGIYSLYTAGQSPNYEAIFFKEDLIPYNFADSAVAIRFINLSPNSPAIKITLAGTPNISQVSELNYRQRTEFKKYPLLKIIPAGSITFEVRNVANNNILTTYTLPASAVAPYTTVSTSLSRFRSLTLAIKGLSGTSTGLNAYSIFPIPQY